MYLKSEKWTKISLEVCIGEMMDNMILIYVNLQWTKNASFLFRNCTVSYYFIIIFLKLIYILGIMIYNEILQKIEWNFTW